MNAAQPPHKFGRDTFAVRIENIAPCVGRHEIIELFSNLIGQVRKCEEHITDEDGRYMEMAFFNRDCSRKALCMSGYTVAGVPLSVSAIAPQPNPRRYDRSNQVDDRRNLYVLGLPFNLTKTEFTDLFARYGTVVHSVILATVDSGSRRRGFIVMSTHSEAKAAMDSLSRAEIKNHIIDVSWAVVQRSQGFLDGGDRTVAEAPIRSQPALSQSVVPPGLQAAYPPSYSQSQPAFPIRYPAPPMSSPFAFPASAQPWPRAISPVAPNTRLPPTLSLSPMTQRIPVEASTTLLVKDLPAVLFASEADLCPLFFPFGDVKRIEFIKTPSMLVDMDSDGSLSSEPNNGRKKSADASRDQVSVCAIVEYTSTTGAREAYQALHGQVYGSCKVSVEFFERPTTSSSSSSLASSMTFDSSTSLSSSEFTPSSSMSSFGDAQNDDRLLTPAYHPFKRHSVAALGGLFPTSGRGFGPSYADFNPDSPPQSAKSMGFPERVSFAEGSYFERTYDAMGGPFNERATDRLERERQYERELAFARRTMYDRSNNTSPFHGVRGYLAPNQPVSSYTPSLQGPGATVGPSEMSREMENRFGAIARPSSSVARFPPGEDVNEREMPPPPVSALAKTKFDELMNSEFSHGALGRGGRMFQSMPDVFDFPSGTALPTNA